MRRSKPAHTISLNLQDKEIITSSAREWLRRSCGYFANLARPKQEWKRAFYQAEAIPIACIGLFKRREARERFCSLSVSMSSSQRALTLYGTSLCFRSLGRSIPGVHQECHDHGSRRRSVLGHGSRGQEGHRYTQRHVPLR